MSETCNVCKGNLHPQHTTFTQWYEGLLIVIENVPARVCEQCGETYYDPAIVEQIQTLIWSGAKPERVIETDVYDLDAA